MSIKNENEPQETSFLIMMWKKFVNRETITYAIAGVLTTLVNLITFDLIANKMHVNDLVANIIAWIFAVSFAYVVNNFWVFHSGVGKEYKEVEKILKFFGARLVTLGIEEAGILCFVTWLHFNNMVVKLGLAVIVIIVNYIFSKLYIFNKDKDEK
ncbi:GtrA family protein [Lachnoclostridium phytofermentans]|nr:GtrA family protein [Lachnoclostridium phytofermentans]